MKMRRRILALCLTLCMLVGLSPVYALAAPVSGTWGTNITWTLDTDGTLTISGKGKMLDYAFRPTPTWCDYNNDITTVVISDGVTSIGYLAFLGCTALTSITIPDSVTSIGDDAFYGCTNLTSITIPDSVTSIGTGAFSYCDVLETITVDNGNPVFCAEDGVLFSKDKTVLHCYPRGLRASSYTVPDTVREIADSAFYQTRLENITIPNSVTGIGDYAFEWCSSLTDITIPNSVTSIGERAFKGSAIQNITIPDSVTSIGERAFESSAIQNITIPAGTTSIGNSPFSFCRDLAEITVDDANVNYCSVDGILFSKDMTTLICYPGGKAGTSYVVPDTVTAIAEYGFSNAHLLQSVVISDSVRNIGDCAFSSCWELQDVVFPKGITGIVYGMFAACGFESITIPDGVTKIDAVAFQGCTNLETITIPASVTKIFDNTFDHLKEVHFGGTRAQWNAITIEVGNEALQTAAIYCSDDAPAESSDTEIIRYGNGAVAEITTAADGTVEVDATVPDGVVAEIIIHHDVDLSAMGNVAIIVNEDGTEEIIQKSIPGEESLTVTLSESAKFEIRDNAVTFSDVAEKNWFKKAVDFVSARGIMGGVGNNTFDHKSTTTRAMVFTMLARLNGVDTAGGATWYEKGTNWVVENGLSDGLNATDVIPREELAVLLWKLNGSPDADTAILDGFSDSEGISASAREAVAWAVATGVMGGNADGTMDPTGGATRAHVAQIIMNYMTKI